MAGERQADSAARFYEGRAATYDYSWHPSFAERFNSHLDISSGQHVLDLACGTGLLTFLEADRVGPSGRVVGVDVTPGMLSQAVAKKEKAGEKYSHVELYQGDILDLDAIDAVNGQTFDVITLASALVLLPDPKAAVKYWSKYLKPGGLLATDSTHPRNLVSGIVLERTAKALDLPIHYNRAWSTSQYALKEVLEAGGLHVEQIITVDNQTGYGKRYYEDSDWDDHFVEKVIVGDTARTFGNHEIRKKAQAIFKEEWEKLAVNGRVEELDTVFLGIARKPLESSTSEAGFSGGCRCGNVKYHTTSHPSDITFCYCRACQQVSGSAYLPFFHVPTYSFKLIESSTLTTLRLSDAADRTYCSACGTPVTMIYTFEPETTAVTVGSVDPQSFKGEWPKVKNHIFLKEKAPWVTLPDDGAERLEAFPLAFAHVIEPYAKPKQSS